MVTKSSERKQSPQDFSPPGSSSGSGQGHTEEATVRTREGTLLWKQSMFTEGAADSYHWRVIDLGSSISGLDLGWRKQDAQRCT